MVTVALVLTAGALPDLRAQSLRTLFEAARPSVVVIGVAEKDPIASWERGDPVKKPGLGSGVLISPDGKVLTAAHVVQVAESIEVLFWNGKRSRARVASSLPSADVALLQLDNVPPGARVAKIGNSDSIQVGDQVMVVGAPYGLSYTMTSGYISGRHSPNAASADLSRAELLQTDAAINPGNSGGPMFNMQGEVVGIVSHILSMSGGFEGLGFAVTSNLARRILLSGPNFWSGVEFYIAGPEVCQLLNIPRPKALIIQKVASGSPSDQLGLRAGTTETVIGDEKLLLGGDVLLGVQGVSLAEENADARIRDAIVGLKRGDKIRLVVWRGGQERELSMPLK